MYRTLEIALLRSFSYSVSSVPIVALRMMPSSILPQSVKISSVI
jgi:hypothetical protein